jgi:Superfamily I DNA and RNA helicases
MDDKQFDLELEQIRLEETISLATKQLNQARQRNEENKSAILSAKKELRENTEHSISNLWSSEGFEALAELNQYVNPVTEKVADYEALEHKITLLENLIRSPYFARIDFKYDDEDMPEPIYIGKTSLKKENSYQMSVYDWRSPIASVFYRFVTGKAYYDAPVGRITGEVTLKRQYEITKGVLEYFFDADVQIVDEFLRKLLSQNTSAKMKTIVESIQKEQDVVIRDMENELMIVQGVAGSGKTSIALHRAAYLMYQDLSTKLSSNNILIISPNTLFEQYIANVIPELGEKNVESVVFEEMLGSILHKELIQTRNQFLENLITSYNHRDRIKSSIEFKTSPQFKKILNLLIRDIPLKWIEFEDIKYEGDCIITKEALKERLVGREDISFGLKIKLLKDFIVDTIYEAKKIRLKNTERYELLKFTEINVFELYRKLFDDIDYFYSLAQNYELPDRIEDILVYTQENMDTKLLQYDDAAAIAYLSLKIFGTNEYRNIKQVVIDEAQDYYPLHYEIFHLLFPSAKFTILGDINQTLEKRENLSLYEQIKTIFNKRKSSLAIMDKSFRCTNEILNFSAKFLEQSMEIKSFNRQGDVPNINAALDLSTHIEGIASEIKLCKDKGYRSIGLICKSEKNAISLYQSLKDRVDVQLIKNETTTDLHGVFIIPVYMSKGLEFDAILICDTDKLNYHSEEDKKLLYIACTRALHRLNLFCLGEVSPLI